MFRGRSPKRTVTLDPGASATVDALIGRAGAEFERTISHPATPEDLAAAGRSFLEARARGDDAVDVLGAAVAWTVLTDQPENAFKVTFLDEMVARYGVASAAEAAVVVAGLRIQFHRPGPGEPPMVAIRSVERRPVNDLLNVHVFEPHSRLRALLAVSTDTEYAAAVSVLRRYRGSGLARDFLISFLVPTDQGWVEEALQMLARVDRDYLHVGWSLLASVTTPDQAETVFAAGGDREHSLWGLGHRLNLVYSMCAHVGAGAEGLVAELFDGHLSGPNKKRMAQILGQYRTDEGMGLLLDRLGRKYIGPAVLEVMTAAPELAYRHLARRATESEAAAELLRDHLRAHPELAGTAGDQQPEGGKGDGGPAAGDGGPIGGDRPGAGEASTDELPAVLIDPPWARPRPRRRTVPAIASPTTPTRLTWYPGEQEQWLAADTYRPWLGGRTWAEMVSRAGLGQMMDINILAHAPEELVRPILADLPAPTRVWHADRPLQTLLGRYGADAVPYVVRVVAARPARTAHVLLPIEGTEITGHMMRWLLSRSMAATAQQWFARHIDTAATDVIAAALTGSNTERLFGERVLRALADRGHRDFIVAAAQHLGTAVGAAVTAVLDTDPLLDLPVRVPELPSWANPALVPPVLLSGTGRALRDGATENLCTMLALSRPGDPYPGIDLIRGTVDARSLAAFAWGLFERWQQAGYPDKQGWVLTAQGVVGDDDTVRALTPLIRFWPLQSAHRRAAAGLEALAAIGTDVALTHLHAIAVGLRFPALRKKADALVELVVDDRGLTSDQLADRLIPDLGLDPDGTTTVDYGNRRFVLSLDERLRPNLVDETGRRITRLPRPTDDDTPSAADEFARYTTLRKDLSSIADTQVRRLEQAMLTGRSWSMAEVRAFLVAHPVMWQLCHRMVWAHLDPHGHAQRLFRFSDRRSPVGTDGADVRIDGTATVSIPHPLHFPGAIDTWMAVFDQLGLVQPFEQLRRSTFLLFALDELNTILRRYEDLTVPTSALLALTQVGWRREEPQDAGAQIAMEKPIGDSHVGVIMVSPGFNAANAMQWKEQKIVHVYAAALGDRAVVDQIAASEIVRDLATLE